MAFLAVACTYRSGNFIHLDIIRGGFAMSLKTNILARLGTDERSADEIAKSLGRDVVETYNALEELKNQGKVILQYIAMRGYVWRVVR